MSARVFRVDKLKDFNRAGSSDLIRLIGPPGGTDLFLPKWVLEGLIAAICSGMAAHISGPSGTAKTSLLEALYLAPDNFLSLCSALGFEERPLHLHAVELALFETPAELFQRRSLRDGNTYDEKSILVRALEEAVSNKDEAYQCIWIRELGRAHTGSIQSALVSLMAQQLIVLPDGRNIDASGIAWVADSNYVAESDALHVLVPFDEALKRRFVANLSLDYLTEEDEVQVLRLLVEELPGRERDDDDPILKVVKLGQIIRRHKAEGRLQSTVPPSLYNYIGFLGLVRVLPHLPLQTVAMMSLLGNADTDDRREIPQVLQEVFGLTGGEDEELDMTAQLI